MVYFLVIVDVTVCIFFVTQNISLQNLNWIFITLTPMILLSIDYLNKKWLTYDEIIKSVLRIMEVSISNKNIQLLQNLNCHETFNTYPKELKQVVLNLIKNAEEALLEKAIKDPTITIATYTKEDTYILEVSDNAGGIPKDIINKIFDPFMLFASLFRLSPTNSTTYSGMAALISLANSMKRAR